MAVRVAVVGAGGSGLAAAYELRHDVDLTIFERDQRPGGHANTVTIEEGAAEIGVDTGFIVFNERTYPQLVAFFDEVGVETIDHRGGFNFFDLDSGLQYGTAELELRLEDVVARYPDEFVTIWHEARRFHRRGLRDFRRGQTNVPLGSYLEQHGFSEDFKHSFVILLASAAWSVPAELIWEMPASAVIGFFASHDPGGLGGREVRWKTVAEGSGTYIRRVLEVIGGDLRVGTEVTAVRELSDGVEVETPAGVERFDFCVVATHADEALRLVEDPSARALDILSRVHYHPSVVVLHTDPSVLPPDRDRWQSWNYGRVVRDNQVETYVVWWLNHIHGFEAERDYFVTLDPPVPIRADATLREIPYTHPILTVDVRDAQSEIYALNDGGPIKYSGSYFHSKELGPEQTGYHEAAFTSGREAGRSIARELSAVPSART